MPSWQHLSTAYALSRVRGQSKLDVTEEFPFLVTKLSPYYDR
jgi:hypothetical protein